MVSIPTQVEKMGQDVDDCFYLRLLESPTNALDGFQARILGGNLEKGINLPDSVFYLSSLTKADLGARVCREERLHHRLFLCSVASRHTSIAVPLG
jgi:hypothetical protein